MGLSICSNGDRNKICLIACLLGRYADAVVANVCIIRTWISFGSWNLRGVVLISKVCLNVVSSGSQAETRSEEKDYEQYMRLPLRLHPPLQAIRRV